MLNSNTNGSSSAHSTHKPMDDQPQPLEDMEGIESETSQEYPESEDGGHTQNGYRNGNGTGRAGTMFHAARSDCDTMNSTTSLYDSDIEYTFIDDRRYCGDYIHPNDEAEQDRWRMLHLIYLDLFNHELTTVPLTNPTRILDVGCGTGDWAMDIATLYPDAEVIGTDIAPIQPTKVVPNVFFEIDDAEIEGGWNFFPAFDLIHFRSMACAFENWGAMYEESWKHLKPGGWIEILDFDDHAGLVEFYKDEKVMMDWYRAIMGALSKSSRTYTAQHLEPAQLEKLGFVEVSTVTLDLPMGAWGKNKEERSSSIFLLELQASAVEALCLRPLVEFGGWKVEDVKRVCGEVEKVVRRMGRNPKTAEGCKYMVKVLRGRKPREGEEVVPPVANGVVPSHANGSANGKMDLLAPPKDIDTDGESVLTVTRENVNGTGKVGQSA